MRCGIEYQQLWTGAQALITGETGRPVWGWGCQTFGSPCWVRRPHAARPAWPGLACLGCSRSLQSKWLQALNCELMKRERLPFWASVSGWMPRFAVMWVRLVPQPDLGWERIHGSRRAPQHPPADLIDNRFGARCRTAFVFCKPGSHHGRRRLREIPPRLGLPVIHASCTFTCCPTAVTIEAAAAAATMLRSYRPARLLAGARSSWTPSRPLRISRGLASAVPPLPKAKVCSVPCSALIGVAKTPHTLC